MSKRLAQEKRQSTFFKEIYSEKLGDVGPFDLVITDLEMTGLSGYDVSQFIKSKNRSS